VSKRIGGTEFEAVMRKMPDPVVPPGVERLDERSLAAAVDRLVRATPGAAQAGETRSARPDETFHVAAPVAAPPPAAPAPARPASEDER
jgi:hypothetical protein